MLLQFNESDGVNCTINTEFFKIKAGIYIMKTLCCWGGNGRWGNKKKKRRVRKKYLKRERKGEENYMGKRGGKLHGKKGEHGLENASFWVINFKNVHRRAGREKKRISKEGGGKCDNIYP